MPRMKKNDWATVRAKKLVSSLTGCKDVTCKNGVSLVSAIAKELRAERKQCAALVRLMRYTTPDNIAIALETSEFPVPKVIL